MFHGAVGQVCNLSTVGRDCILSGQVTNLSYGALADPFDNS